VVVPLLLATLLDTSTATPLPEDRPWVPSAGVAAEAGPLLSWVNPALPGFDPDPRAGLVAAASGDGRRSIGAAAGVGGLTVGLGTIEAPERTRRWVATYGSSAELPGRISLGTSLSWHLVGGAGNHLAVDAGVGWRPRAWLGFGGVLRNIGAPDPLGSLPSAAAIGATVRPWRDAALLSVDVERRGGPQPTVRGVASARLRPREGLFVRASATTDFAVGVGVEAYFGGAGVGLHAARAPDGVRVGAIAIGTDEPGESVAPVPARTWILDLRADLPTTARGGLFGGVKPGHLDTLERLRRLRTGPPPRAVLVKLGGASASWARRHEVRDELLALRERGVPVVAWLDGAAGPGDVWLASAADHVAAHPAADIELVGPRRKLTYLRGLYDRLGVRFEVVRRGDYKSAVEPQILHEPSEFVREQELALLDQLHARLIEDLARGRGVTPDVAEGWLRGPWTADEALDLGIVDALVWPDALEEYIATRVTEGRAPRLRPLQRLPQRTSGWEASGGVAIVIVEGVILPGPSSPGLLGPKAAGSQTIARLLSGAAEDPTIRAVVLRVDSPGGSLYASDEIWRAADRVRAAGKPLVVSFGGVAASGGYFIATAADAIWAEPTTITGSIGVFLQKPDFSEVLSELGVRITTLERGGGARLDLTRPLRDDERARYDAIVGAGYERFKLRVSRGRGMSLSAVEAVASGRVWSGADARANGLVDRTGSFVDAIEDARRRAGLPGSAPTVLLAPGISPTVERLAPLLASLARARATRDRSSWPEPLREVATEIALHAALQREALWLLAPLDPETR
jgi:protease IV